MVSETLSRSINLHIHFHIYIYSMSPEGNLDLDVLPRDNQTSQLLELKSNHQTCDQVMTALLNHTCPSFIDFFFMNESQWHLDDVSSTEFFFVCFQYDAYSTSLLTIKCVRLKKLGALNCCFKDCLLTMIQLQSEYLCFYCFFVFFKQNLQARQFLVVIVFVSIVQ